MPNLFVLTLIVIHCINSQLHRDRVSVVQPEHEDFSNRVLRPQQSVNGSLSFALDEDGKGYKRFLLPPTHSRIAQRRMRRKTQLQQMQLVVASLDAVKDVKVGAPSPAEIILSAVGVESETGSLLPVAAGVAASSSSAVSTSATAENESKNLSSSSESSSESEEEALVDGFRFVNLLSFFLLSQGRFVG